MERVLEVHRVSAVRQVTSFFAMIIIIIPIYCYFYQKLKSLSFGFWRELSRHGDDVAVPDDDGSAGAWREKSKTNKTENLLEQSKLEAGFCFF